MLVDLAGARVGPVLVRERSHEALAPVHHVRGDQRGEEQALRPDERPDRQLAAVDTGGGRDHMSFRRQ